jgi:riboflavin kinase/FMN adenylyltransferase
VKVYSDFEAISHIQNPVLTIGTFDGVHVGHQKIIERLNKKAEEVGGESVLFTFFPHPRMVINPENHGIKLIQSQAEKLEKLERLGLDHLIVFPFTEAFSELTAHDFVYEFLVKKLKVHTIIVGYDHQFGKNREGNLTYLINKGKAYHFDVIEIPAQDINDVNVSSSKIRQALDDGKIAIANHYLNEPFQLWGKVIHGNKLGRTIGFPTANVAMYDPLKIIPAFGVYGVSMQLADGKLVYGMMNIGNKPTVNDDKSTYVEVSIFDFSEDIYDTNVRVFLHTYVRTEKKFDSLNELIIQIQKDEQVIRSYFHM